MNGAERGGEIRKIFEEREKEQKGKMREVFISTVETTEGSFKVVVKEIRNNDEVKALKTLTRFGRCEQLLAFDEKSMLVGFEKGTGSIDFINNLLDLNPKKIVTLTEDVRKFAGKDIVFRTKKVSLPAEVLQEDLRVREVCRDFAATLYLQVLLGIFQSDMKEDNLIFTEDGEVKFIDFGEAKILGESKFRDGGLSHVYNNEISTAFEMFRAISPCFEEVSRKFKQFASLNIKQGIESFFEELYKKYLSENILLEKRVDFLKKCFSDKEFKLRFVKTLEESGFPEFFSNDVADRVERIFEVV